MIASEAKMKEPGQQFDPHQNLQKKDYPTNYQKRSPEQLKDVNICISQDAIQRLRQMSRDQSSLKSIQAHLKDWTSLKNVCKACKNMIRREGFFKDILRQIRDVESYLSEQSQYQSSISLIRLLLHYAFSFLQLPHNCLRQKNARMEYEQRSFEDDSSEIADISEENCRQSGSSSQEYQESISNQSILEKVIDLQESEC